MPSSQFSIFCLWLTIKGTDVSKRYPALSSHRAYHTRGSIQFMIMGMISLNLKFFLKTFFIKIYWDNEFFSEILISKIGVKIIFEIIMKKYTAGPSLICEKKIYLSQNIFMWQSVFRWKSNNFLSKFQDICFVTKKFMWHNIFMWQNFFIVHRVSWKLQFNKMLLRYKILLWDKTKFLWQNIF